MSERKKLEGNFIIFTIEGSYSSFAMAKKLKEIGIEFYKKIAVWKFNINKFFIPVNEKQNEEKIIEMLKTFEIDGYYKQIINKKDNIIVTINSNIF